MNDLSHVAASEDGNFKRGAFKPIAIIVGIVVAIGGVVLIVLGVHSEGDKMTVDQVAKVRKELEVMSKAEQMPKWREWALRADVPALQQDAFENLAWEKDGEGLKLIIEKGLGSDDHRIRGTAATALLEYGSPAADAAKPALLKDLQEADESDKPQICWALATIHAGEAFDTVLAEYRAGHLAKVQKLDQNPAFDPDVLASMVTLDKLASLSGDPSDSVRQLVATVLSRSGDPKWTSQLVQLVTDKSVEVGREAAVGLGKIANEATMGPLIQALQKADRDSRAKFLEALRDGVGSNGLILAIGSVSHETVEREKFQTKQLFDMMRELEDPRAGDALVKYIASNPKPHWKTEAALRLAEIGDTRAVPTLAWRMTQDPLKLYNKIDDPELLLDDNERVVSARMLADLAILNPDKQAEIRDQAEPAVMGWLTDKPQPHANGLRFIAAAGAMKDVAQMRKWASPRANLPKEGQQDFPQDWATAQSALRYLGWMRDPPSWGLLEHQLFRRPVKVDATMESLMQGGLAVLGMTLRAVGVGAAHGFAQWGDPRAYPLLVKYVEDPMNNEQSRIEACFSLSWVATDDEMKEVARKVFDFNKADPKSQLVRGCYLETLIHRPVPGATAGLMDLLKPDIDVQVRLQAARAIGMGGVTKEMAAQLLEKAKDINLKADAVLALLIGSDPETAGRALASYNDAPPEAMEEIKGAYSQTFGYWSDKNYDTGDVARWIKNAEACQHVTVNGSLQDWPKAILSRAIQEIEFDNGPHSLTRVQFRMRLYNDARGTDDAKRASAIEVLKFMKEKGVLMALRGEKEPLGSLAQKAFFEVMNPKLVTEKLPDAPAAQNPNGATVMPPH
jgi:HEAT repeat protein